MKLIFTERNYVEVINKFVTFIFVKSTKMQISF